MNLTLKGRCLHTSTKQLMGLLVTGGTLVQIPQVHDPLIAFSHTHPHYTGFITFGVGFLLLLKNPVVCKCLGIQEQP